eukprot:Seg1582.18 transcript_id=Seg1582.18/GoldUCD/mRNA.D3Y31 product="hypothetical protein" protein_id=Seg1582.18/GoldUCD/D3Y31
MEEYATIKETLPPIQPTGIITASGSVMLQYQYDRYYSHFEEEALFSARSEIFAQQKTMIKAMGRDRKPNLLFKGTNYSQSIKLNGELQPNKRDFLIIGNKINLQLRDKKERTQCIEERYRNCEGVSRRNEEGENCSKETVTSHEYRIQVENGCEGVEAQVTHKQDSFLEGKSYDITDKEEAINKQRKRLLEKRGPQITVSLPSSTKNKDGEGFDQQSLFNQRTYLVCAQSPSCASRWRTTSINFPDEAWKLERRRLSHRRSSLGSSISLSFARLDLVCNTPEHSPVSTPICDKNFVFPNINGR